jgi:hypothetical protein
MLEAITSITCNQFMIEHIHDYLEFEQPFTPKLFLMSLHLSLFQRFFSREHHSPAA